MSDNNRLLKVKREKHRAGGKTQDKQRKQERLLQRSTALIITYKGAKWKEKENGDLEKKIREIGY